MNKKDLKWYETPVLEVIELESEAVLLAGSPGDEDDDVKDGFEG